ncbi:MAG: hypothetical protein WAX89_04150 [Alphaproteobacteria bacterium]
MVSYADVAQFASEAYMNALLEHTQEAKDSTENVLKPLVGEHLAHTIADEVDLENQLRLNRITYP